MSFCSHSIVSRMLDTKFAHGTAIVLIDSDLFTAIWIVRRIGKVIVKSALDPYNVQESAQSPKHYMLVWAGSDALMVTELYGQFISSTISGAHDDVIKWNHFPRYWPFVRGIHRSPVNSPHKGQWRGALMFSLICPRINGWVNNGEAGDLIHHRVLYDVIVMPIINLF